MEILQARLGGISLNTKAVRHVAYQAKKRSER